MNKTQKLIALIESGSRRIDSHNFVSRWVESRNEWVSDQSWRADVVRRAAFHFYRLTRKAA